ncbi:hypothetical protein [Cupriavidus agavae]|uniref:hypothetical protein n=1 Tax=Cupriavidus agavae TaxID=1001822 RepID=UPI00102BAF70|nr:hypothetical protein [Cupriavidus agavae]
MDWRVYAFADAGQLRLRDPLPEQESRFSLASVGIGTSFRLARYVNGRPAARGGQCPAGAV